MRAAALLTGLYPPAVRERWGAEISGQVSESGIRSWPDTVAGAVRLWMRPSDWPETYTGQTRRVLAVALFAIIAAATLLLRAGQPSTALTADPGRPVTSLWLAPILLGVALAAPLPVLRGDVLRRLATAAIRRLAAPAAAGAGMVAAAHSGLVDHPTGLADAALVTVYWAVLGFGALRMCALIARVARDATPPSRPRLRAAHLLVGAGLALAAAQSLLTIAAAPATAGALTIALATGLLAAAALGTAHDLRARAT